MFVILLFGCANRQKSSEWRGPDRAGIFYETGLLKEWPENGPELLWSYEGLGAGHSSVGIGNDRIYINGMPDTLGVLYAFDLEGNLLWEKVYGEEWHRNYTGPRSTPLVIGNRIYLESGMGEVCCFDAGSGEIIWKVDLKQEYGGRNIQWGMTESLLIDGDKLICTPGGAEHNIVALDRFTGEKIWSSPGYREQSAYCSPLLVNHNGTRLVVTMTATSALAVDAETGEMYWRVEQNQVNKIHANTPVYSDGILYFSSSWNEVKGGLLALELSDNGKEVKELWRNETYTNLMGGSVLIDGVLYGSSYRSKEWFAIDARTGEANIIADDFTNGVIVYADGLFYCYNERGILALVDMDRDSFNIISRFKVELGTDQHWAHPVIHDKKMYIRHGDALMVYDISAE